MLSEVIFDEEGNPLDAAAYAEAWYEEHPEVLRRYLQEIRRQDKRWQIAVEGLFS